MNVLFALLSIAYIVGIFLLAELPAKSDFLQKFNPYSLAHIPLYGVLALLLILAFRGKNLKWQRILFPIPITVAITVAILDEFYQAYIPGREGSVADILLDLIGIVSAGFIMFKPLVRTPSRH